MSSEFGQQLRRLRRAAGLTQAALAERAALSMRGIQDLELGARQMPHRDTAERLAEALNLDDAGRAALLRARVSPVEPSTQASSTAVSGEPVPLSSFVGRENLLEDIGRYISGARLITLTGPGGIGKTRLALEVCRAARERSADTIILVDLGPVANPEYVLQSVASAMHVQDSPVGVEEKSLADALVEIIRTKSLMLVLDNCEHLVEACAELVSKLLGASVSLHVLATSREPLRVPGEIVVAVPALSLPPAENATLDEILRESEAAALFVQRAREARSQFELTRENVLAVAEICRRLDGIPLALEMAAARIRVLSPKEIASRLDSALALLSVGSRTAPTHQQTLRATLDWSYKLLKSDERLLFTRLAVFNGGFDLEAAEAICGGGAVGPATVLELLAAVVDKSLVMAEDFEDSTRYRLLEVVREYAQERLRESSECEQVHRAHRQWYMQLAERFESLWRGPKQAMWLDRIAREQPNLRAALGDSITAQDIGTGLRLAAAMWQYHEVRGGLGEARDWLSELSQLADDTVPRWVRAKALWAAGHLAAYQADPESGDALLAESLRLWRELGDPRGCAWTLRSIGMAAYLRRDIARAEAAFRECLEFARRAEDNVVAYVALHFLSLIAERRGEIVEAIQGEEESLVLKHRQRDAWAISFSLLRLAYMQTGTGDPDAARQLARQALEVRRDLRSARGIADCVRLLAEISSTDGQPLVAARLFGAAQALWETHFSEPGEGLVGLEAVTTRLWEREAPLDRSRSVLGDAAFEVAFRQGREMTPEQAVDYALEATASAVP